MGEKRADHLLCRRGWGVEIYTHHGIDLGDGRVIHYTGETGRKESARIAFTSFQEFSSGDPVEPVAYGICDEPDVVIARAMSRLGAAPAIASTVILNRTVFRYERAHGAR